MYPEIPPRVEYGLTDLGNDLLPNIRNLIAWASNNMDRIEASRKRKARESLSGQASPSGPAYKRGR